jgi:hypothetical protein
MLEAGRKSWSLRGRNKKKRTRERWRGLGALCMNGEIKPGDRLRGKRQKKESTVLGGERGGCTSTPPAP